LAASDVHGGLAAAEGQVECRGRVTSVNLAGLCRCCVSFVNVVDEGTELGSGFHRDTYQPSLLFRHAGVEPA